VDIGPHLASSRLAALGLAALLPIAAACGNGTGNDTAGTSTTTRAEAAPGATHLPQGDDPIDTDPAAFTVDIDNEYWPMEPGAQWTYREVDEEGQELAVVVTVSSETKKVANGVTARIVRDTVTENGEVVEDTFDWYAQDTEGNVWYLGEDTAEFESGVITSRAGAWEAGVDGALPGIIMPAVPRDDMKYRQEFSKGEAEDNGEVLGVEEQVEVAAGHYDDAVLTKDTTTLEPDVVEYKLYARGVGPVLTLGVSGGGGREELVGYKKVSDALARAAGTAPLGKSYSHARGAD
jgi:hypothetical protein